MKTSHLLFRQSDSIVEKMFQHWLTICLYPYLTDSNGPGKAFFCLYRVLKYQTEKGNSICVLVVIYYQKMIMKLRSCWFCYWELKILTLRNDVILKTHLFICFKLISIHSFNSFYLSLLRESVDAKPIVNYIESIFLHSINSYLLGSSNNSNWWIRSGANSV